MSHHPSPDPPAGSSPIDTLLDQLADRVADRVLARLNGHLAPPATTADRLLSAAEVAAIMGVKENYVYTHAPRWPFTRKMSPKVLRFSEQGLRQWLERRRSAP